MTELLQLLLGKNLQCRVFTPFSQQFPIFITSFSEIWEGLISIAASVEFGTGWAFAHAPWIRLCSVTAKTTYLGQPCVGNYKQWLPERPVG